jgi:hypothetical protein
MSYVVESTPRLTKSLDASGGSVFRQLACCGEGCVKSRRPVNSNVMPLPRHAD